MQMLVPRAEYESVYAHSYLKATSPPRHSHAFHVCCRWGFSTAHTYLMKSYSFRHLNQEQCFYNYTLLRAGRAVRNTFGTLANTWWVFLITIPLEPEGLPWITLAVLSLHNYLWVQATDTHIPHALLETEDKDHNIIPGSWCSDTTL